MTHPTQTTGEAQYVTLGIEREIFAVPVETVLEILDIRPLFRLPEAPAYLAGLIDVRGKAVPVIDLRVKLGRPASAATETTRILVIEIMVGSRSLVLGLIADRVLEVLAIDLSQIEAAPDIGVAWHSDYIHGVGRRGDGFVIILDLPRLFSSDDVALLAAKAPLESPATAAA